MTLCTKQKNLSVFHRAIKHHWNAKYTPGLFINLTNVLAAEQKSQSKI